jgi:CHAD domain-containing protein
MPSKANQPNLYRRLSRFLRETGKKPLAKRVHQLRTTARRLESLLDAKYATPPRAVEKLLKQVARVRKRAGQVRDVDVQIEALKTVNIGREERAKQQLLDDLQEMRAKRERKLLALLEDRDRARLQKRLRQVEQAGAAPRAAFLQKVRGRARAELKKTLASAANPATFSPDCLHGFRLQCKRTRYLFELGSDPATARTIEQLKAMQDAVGEWHDWLTLAQTASQRLPARSALQSALENIARAKFAQAVSLSKRTTRELGFEWEERAATPVSRKRPAAASLPATAVEAHASA